MANTNWTFARKPTTARLTPVKSAPRLKAAKVRVGAATASKAAKTARAEAMSAATSPRRSNKPAPQGPRRR